MLIRNNANHRLYDRNRQAQEIWRATQPELDMLLERIWQILTNTRASLADIEGIEMWEAIYGIMPNLLTDTLEDRRERVLEMKRTTPPFTEPWLTGNPNGLAEHVNGELYNRTGDNTITAIVRGLTLYLSILMEVGENIEDQQRTVREILPWMRHIIPTNVLIILHEIFKKPLPPAQVIAWAVMTSKSIEFSGAALPAPAL